MSLKRVLGRWDATWLVAGAIVGAGIFVLPGLVAARLPGAFWMLGAWILGGLLALAGAAVYGELGSRLPRAGGDYRFLYESFGPLPAFLSGWAAFLMTFSAAAAAMAIASMEHVRQAVPVVQTWPKPVLSLAGAVVILVLTAINAAGSRIAGRTTMVLTALPMAGLTGLFVIGLATGTAEIRWPAGSWAPPSGSWLLALGAGLIPVYFAYSGWNAAAYMAGEMKEPRRHLPLALVVGTSLVIVLYLGLNIILLVSLSPVELSGNTTAVADAARLLIGPGAERLLSGVIAVAILGTINVTLMAGARIYYAMAGDNLAPRAMGRVNDAGVPGTALWTAGIWSALLAGAGSFELLYSWSTMAILLLSSLTVAGLFVLRRRQPAAPFLCPGYPVTPIVYLLASLGVAFSSAVTDPWTSLSGIALVAAGIPVYLVLFSGRTSSQPE